MLDAFQSEALQRLDVTVTGSWLPGAVRDWRGEASAREPIVAIAFVVRAGRAWWCKSERGAPGGQKIRLLLGHYDAAGRDIQVAFEIGEGQARSRTAVPSREYLPNIDTCRSFSTAVIAPFCMISGDPPVQLRALFLAAADVEVGRNGIWHLRSRLVPNVPESFQELLTRGRAGELAAA